MTEETYKRMLQNATRDVKLLNLGAVIPTPPAITASQVEIESMHKAMVLGVRPTTDEEKLNKTEAAYLAWLRCLGPWWIGVQSVTLKLGHDCRYTPDFFALDQEGMRAIDTKATRKDTGKALVEEDSMIKMRVAARLFPWCKFLIAYRNGAVWDHVTIKP